MSGAVGDLVGEPAAPPPEAVAHPPLILATGLGAAEGGLATAAAFAVSVAGDGDPAEVLMLELGSARRRGPTLLASPAARGLEERVRGAGFPAAVARGHLCWLALPGGEGAADAIGAALAAACPARLVVAHLPPEQWPTAVGHPALEVTGALLRADPRSERPLAALAVHELRGLGLPVRIATRAPGRVGARRALAGVSPGGPVAARTARLVRGLLRPERGSALPLVAGAAFVVVFVAMVLAALGGAITGGARAQRAADLAALSAARSMRDDLPELLAPPRLPNGLPNSLHMPKGEYLARARVAALEAGGRNGVAPQRLRVSFPDAASFAPLRAQVSVLASIDPAAVPGAGRRDTAPSARRDLGVELTAEAEAAPPAGFTGTEPVAAGGGYQGPLAHRQGQPMRPDVAAAFDRLAAAAARDGIALVISSAYRSDAEQARLFAQNPDPRWVAPPGKSLHRCATELDLGPAGSYSWLARNAARFGFRRRYSWEPWHYGYVAGPAPCAPVDGRAEADGGAAAGGLPGFVPGAYRAPLLRAAAQSDVAAGLLAAQLMAESGFDPDARSPAGALGIAQFMPATAAAYGLRDPFDPEAAIAAQARLMSDLVAQFGSVPLALAAYNAGPGAVESCGCVPAYPETRAYVARILALLDNAGELLVPQLEVRLVA